MNIKNLSCIFMLMRFLLYEGTCARFFHSPRPNILDWLWFGSVFVSHSDHSLRFSINVCSTRVSFSNRRMRMCEWETGWVSECCDNNQVDWVHSSDRPRSHVYWILCFVPFGRRRWLCVRTFSYAIRSDCKCNNLYIARLVCDTKITILNRLSIST